MQTLPPPSVAALTVNEFCRRYSVSRTTFYDQVKARRLEIRKVGHKSIVLTEEAERWLAALPSSCGPRGSTDVSR